MQVPKYSLLLPVRNETRRVGEVVAAVSAALAGTPDPSAWEVLFGDDASDDGTREALASLSRAHPFRLVAPDRNLGRGAIRNLLAREARGEVLVFLDGDCAPRPGYLRAWEDLDPAAAYVGRVDYERVPASGFSRFLAEGSGVAKLRGRAEVPAAYFISQNFRVPRAVFEHLGGFRTDFRGWGGEDTDFGQRLAATGMPLRYRREAEVRHPSVTSLADYLDRLEAFGRTSMPALLRDHPALARQFKLHLARPPFSLVLLNPAARRLARALAVGFPGVPWPFAIYRYLLYNSYARGWLAGTRGDVPRGGDAAPGES